MTTLLPVSLVLLLAAPSPVPVRPPSFSCLSVSAEATPLDDLQAHASIAARWSCPYGGLGRATLLLDGVPVESKTFAGSAIFDVRMPREALPVEACVLVEARREASVVECVPIEDPPDGAEPEPFEPDLRRVLHQ